MSHFTVLVIGNDVDAALEPYDETLEQAPYVEYTKQQLIDKSKKQIEDYKNGRYAEYLKDPVKYKEEFAHNPGHIKYIEEEFPLQLQWTDEEHYQDQIKWYKDQPGKIGANGELYSTSNPKGYWDWYQIGGRWAGNITVKPGTIFETPNFSWGWSQEEKEKCMETLRTDSALLKDIDFDSMNADNLKDFQERYELLKQPWDEIDFGLKVSRFWGDVEQSEYVQAGHTLQEYIDEYMPHPLTAYAYIHNGIWYARGEMISFGMSVDAMQKPSWNKQFTQFIDSLDPETRITFVDCHV